jgi:hypothetical protein
MQVIAHHNAAEIISLYLYTVYHSVIFELAYICSLLAVLRLIY